MIMRLIVFLALLWGPAAWAQYVVRVGAGKLGIDFSGLAASGADGGTFRKVLEADLKRSDWFVPASGASAGYRVTGTAGAGSARVSIVDSAGASSYSKSISYGDGAVRRQAHKMADDIILALTGKKGMNSGRIALLRRVGGGCKQLYVCDCDGENCQQITRDNCISLAPNISPDGLQVVYTSWKSNFPEIYYIKLETGTRTQLVRSQNGVLTSGGISPDGSRYAFIRSINGEGNPNLYVSSLTRGSQPVPLTSDRDIEASPCWSPDGRRIAYVSGPVNRPGLRIISSSGGAPTPIRLPGTQNVAPDWGPDGRIAIASLLYGSFQITVVDPNTGQSTVVTDGGANYEDPTWAPDGRHVLCARSSRNGPSSLVLVDTMVAEGQTKPPPFPLTLPEGDWYSPSWSRQ